MKSLRTFVLSCLALTSLACAKKLTERPAQKVTTSTVEEPMISPERKENEDWNLALNRELSKLSSFDQEVAAAPSSVIKSAKPYTPSLDVSALPEWTASSDALLQVFKTLRDERYYKDPNRVGFMRRATWLYPRDGCYARAGHSAQSAGRSGYVRPGKVFAFGHLKFATPFANGGVQYWSYHVAAAYRIGSAAIILDPVLDPLRPLSLAEWVAKIKSGSSQTKISVCDTWAYGIYHRCLGGNSSSERSLNYHVKKFLPLEWSNVRARGFDPVRLLGDEPPWPQDFDAYFDVFFPAPTEDPEPERTDNSAASFLSPKPFAISDGVWPSEFF